MGYKDGRLTCCACGADLGKFDDRCDPAECANCLQVEMEREHDATHRIHVLQDGKRICGDEWSQEDELDFDSACAHYRAGVLGREMDCSECYALIAGACG